MESVRKEQTLKRSSSLNSIQIFPVEKKNLLQKEIIIDTSTCSNAHPPKKIMIDPAAPSNAYPPKQVKIDPAASLNAYLPKQIEKKTFVQKTNDFFESEKIKNSESTKAIQNKTSARSDTINNKEDKLQIEKKFYHVYADGSCQPNPGPGGWGFLLFDPKMKEIVFENSNNSANNMNNNQNTNYDENPKDCETTNNIMELMAAIEGLKEVKRRNAECHVYVDSQYVQVGITKWIKNWEHNGWKASKGAVKNVGLWKELLALTRSITGKIEWFWVKAHTSGRDGSSVLNARVDELASSQTKSIIGKKFE